MRTIVFAFMLALGIGTATVASADGCYHCASGSSCDQCRYGSEDTQDARKACEARGCKIAGTMACSSAANIKSCSIQKVKPVLACLSR
jgi:hypothetical protein